MIQVSNLSKSYGDRVGISRLNFTIEKGEILGFLGPNGAGKTTTMNIITGYVPPSDGQVTIDGIDVHRQPLEAKGKIGYLPDSPPLYPALQVDQYLRFVCGIKGVPKKTRADHIEKIMMDVGLTDVSKRLIQNLSKGYKQRVGLAQALISGPEFIVLDEPTNGLDPKQIAEIRALIQGIGRHSTVILSSHILTEINMICDRVVIIDKGGIIAIDTPENLAGMLVEYDRFYVKVKAPSEDFRSKCREIDGVIKVEAAEGDIADSNGFTGFIIENDRAVDVRTPLFLLMAESGYIAHEIKSIDIGLEDVFLRFTERVES